jgi:hypothetical protein
MRLATKLNMEIAECLLTRSRSRLRRTFLAVPGEVEPWLTLRFSDFDIDALRHLVTHVGKLYGLSAHFRVVSPEAAELLVTVATEFLNLPSLTTLDEQTAHVLRRQDNVERPILSLGVQQPLSAQAAEALTADSESDDGPLDLSLPLLLPRVAQGLARHRHELYLNLRDQMLSPDAARELAQHSGYALTCRFYRPLLEDSLTALASNPNKRMRIKEFPSAGFTRVHLVNHDMWCSGYEDA